jgi:hypothetical protein
LEISSFHPGGKNLLELSHFHNVQVPGSSSEESRSDSGLVSRAGARETFEEALWVSRISPVNQLTLNILALWIIVLENNGLSSWRSLCSALFEK